MHEWICKICGYRQNGEEPPEICPICGALDVYFDKLTEDNRQKYAHLLVDTQ